MTAEALRRLILEEPRIVVIFLVQQLVHLVFLTLYLVSDFLCAVQHNFFGRLRAHVDREKLLGARFDTEQSCLLQSLPLPIER